MSGIAASAPPEASASRDLLTIMVALALPMTRLQEVEVIGVLFLHDLLAPVVLLVLLMRRESWVLLKPLKPFLILLGIWLASQVATDLYRGSAFVDYSRGWSRIGLLAINTLTYWLLSGGRLKILAVVVFSAGMTMILNVYFNPSSLNENFPWKFGIGSGVALMTASLGVSYNLRRWLGPAIPAVMILMLALISLAQDARSQFAICALTAAYSFFALWASKRPAVARRITPAIFFLMIAGGAIAGQGMIAGYGALAERGVLGYDARVKYLQQSGSGGNLIIGGRSTLLVATQAIADSPILGHGSWAHNPYYVQIYFLKLREYGLPVPENYRQLGEGDQYLIPTHSHFFGSWVEAGVLSIFFWIWVLMLAFTALYSVLKRQEQPNVLVTYMALTMLWDIPFSPFASDQRIIEAIEICVLIVAARALNPRGLMSSVRTRAPFANRPAIAGRPVRRLREPSRS